MKPTLNTNPFKVSVLLLSGIICLALFRMDYEHPQTSWDENTRNLLILGLILFSSAIIFLKAKAEILSLIYFPLLLFIGLELLSRPIIKNLVSIHEYEELKKMREWTYDEFLRYESHPFLQYTGNEKHPKPYDINSNGFVGNEFHREKDSSIYRILAIGGSTTERGYPAILEDYLNKESKTYEVFNMGISGWTTAHSLNNLALNGLAYQPDLIIIHHAWNDVLVRNVDEEKFKSDYSHVYKSFEKPQVYDRYLLRASLLYRYLKWLYSGKPSWTALDLATVSSQVEYQNNNQFTNIKELMPFERNIRSMIQLAQSNSIDIILSTQPHSTDPEIPLYESALHIDQCNEILRGIAKDFPSIHFLDLDSLISGKRNDFFIDLGHMTEEGKRYKAEQFGKIVEEKNAIP